MNKLVQISAFGIVTEDIYISESDIYALHNLGYYVTVWRMTNCSQNNEVILKSHVFLKTELSESFFILLKPRLNMNTIKTINTI